MLSLSKQRLERRLGYTFNDKSLFDLALTHRSFGARNNERLEFLGDSILNLTIANALFHKFPEAREGQLSRLRAQLVKGETLSEVAREFEIGECLILGEGELKSGGHRRDSILADSVEALIGAIANDASLAVAQEKILDWFASRLQAVSLEQPQKDGKTLLQEYLQSRRQSLPEYVVVQTCGEAHAQQFTVECRVKLLKEPTQATASNRKVAEKQAALLALELLQGGK